jgi:thiamine biosynthesis lipoprotein
MGMPISLALRGRHQDDAVGEQAWQAVLASLRQADQTFSTYRADSEISRLGRAELAIDDCSLVVHDVLRLAERARVESGGAFDVRRNGEDGQLVLDPSGIVKGWAVQRASLALAALDATDFCLSAGGDMVCHTAMPGSPGWRIGIEDPFDPAGTVAVIPVRNGAVATSGLAHRGAHIVDPRTGKTPNHFASVTVVAADLTAADIDATTAFVLGAAARDWLEARPGRTGLLVGADGATSIFGSAV